MAEKKITIEMSKGSDGLGANLLYGKDFVCMLNMKDYKFDYKRIVETIKSQLKIDKV